MILLKLLSLKLRVDGSIALKDISERGVREGGREQRRYDSQSGERIVKIHTFSAFVSTPKIICLFFQ